jgi:hypothetical protein
MSNGWIGVDFDGTLAVYDGWKGASHLGEPVGPMRERVKRWRAEGHQVKIFTARAYCPELPSVTTPQYSEVMRRRGEAVEALRAIRAWCRQHLGETLEVTCVKDYGMIELWDDRAVQVIANTGEPVGQSTRGLV